MQLRVATWNMQGGGKQFYAKLSHLLKQTCDTNDYFTHYRQIFCLQEIGSFREFYNMILEISPQRQIRESSRGLRFCAGESHMIDNTFYVASMLLYFRDKYYYLYAEWRGVDVEYNARCGVAIMAQVYGIDTTNLQGYINLINQQQANIIIVYTALTTG